MNIDLSEPLEYYNQYCREKHHRNAEEYFDKLTEKSGINTEDNRRIVNLYKEQLKIAENLDKRLGKYKTYRVLLIVLCLIDGIAGLAGIENNVLLSIVAAIIIVISVWIIIKKINPPLKNTSAVLEEERAKGEQLLAQAWAQMAPLNILFDERDPQRLIETTIPELKFDKYYTLLRHRTMVEQYEMDDSEDEEKSIGATLSGELFGNPFVFERSLNHEMSTEVYTGELLIRWVETYTDGDGNVVRTQRSQVLYASVEKPKPTYRALTELKYCHSSSPDLSFSRSFDHVERLSEKAVENKIKAGEKRLQKEARRATRAGGQLTELANSRFDILFGALDRDNEIQFRLMFTPLVQTEMVKLLRSKDTFGDDFNFIKNRKSNIIVSEHSQEWEMAIASDRFSSYDYDAARESFISFNDEYFRSVYFDFAPLVCIPIYRESSDILSADISDCEQNYTSDEYEAIANHLDLSAAVAPDTVTEAIVKAKFGKRMGDIDFVSLDLHSYTVKERVDYVPVLGGDGYYHDVAVPWLEYIPARTRRRMAVKAVDLKNTDIIAPSLTEYRDDFLRISGKCAYYHGLFAYLLDPEEDDRSAYEKIAFLEKYSTR